MALQWKDIDFGNQIIDINKTLAELKSGESIIQDTKTESSNRIVKIDQ